MDNLKTVGKATELHKCSSQTNRSCSKLEYIKKYQQLLAHATHFTYSFLRLARVIFISPGARRQIPLVGTAK